MFSFIKKYQSGGMLDVNAMRADIKGDRKFFKDGDYTMAGRRRLSAIQSIDDNQARGLKYDINDGTETFKIVDAYGNRIDGDIEGVGMGLKEGRGNPLYGLVGRENVAKKEISKTLAGGSQYLIKKTVQPTTPEPTRGGPEPDVAPTRSVIDVALPSGPKNVALRKRGYEGGVKNDFGGRAYRSDLSSITSGIRPPGGYGGAGGVKGNLENAEFQFSSSDLPESQADYAKGVEENLRGLFRTVHNDAVGGGSFNMYTGSGGPSNPAQFRAANVDPYFKEMQARKGGNDPTAFKGMTTYALEQAYNKEKKTADGMYFNQAEETTKQALAYLEDQINRLTVDNSFVSDEEKQGTINYLRSKQEQISLKLDDVYSNRASEDAFKAFYNGEVPGASGDITLQRHWDKDKQKVVSHEQFWDQVGEQHVIAQKADAAALKQGGESHYYKTAKEKAALIDHMHQYRKFYGDYDIIGGNQNWGKDSKYDKSRPVSYFIDEINNPTKDHEDFYLPKWDQEISQHVDLTNITYGNTKNLSRDQHKWRAQHIAEAVASGKSTSKWDWKVWSVDFGDTTQMYYFNPNRGGGVVGRLMKSKTGYWMPVLKTDTLAYLKKGIFERAESKRKGGVIDMLGLHTIKTLIPKVQKAQLGGIDWSAINGILEKQKQNQFYPSISGYTPEEDARRAGIQDDWAAGVASGMNDPRYGQTMNYADAPTAEEVAKNKLIEGRDATAMSIRGAGGPNDIYPTTNPKGSGGPNDLEPSHGDNANNQRLKGKGKYRQEGREGDKKSFNERGFGFSKTGLNTPMGELQYGDISNLIFAIRAKNKKIAEVPVFQEKFTAAGARNVLAARDIDASMLNAAENEIANSRSQYQGSDPIMDMIGKNMAHESKRSAKLQLIASRSQYRRGEEDRVASEMEQRRQQLSADRLRATDTENRNEERLIQGEAMKAAELVRKESQFDQNINSIIQNIQGRGNMKAAANKQFEQGISVTKHQDDVAGLQGQKQGFLDNRSNFLVQSQNLERQYNAAQTSGDTEAMDRLLEQKSYIEQRYAQNEQNLVTISGMLARLQSIDSEGLKKESAQIDRGQGLFSSYGAGGKLQPRR
jgi:hypothetical protein